MPLKKNKKILINTLIDVFIILEIVSENKLEQYSLQTSDVENENKPKRIHSNISDDKNEVYDDPNLQSKDQNELKIPKAKLHLTISNKWTDILQCFGLTQDPLNGDYMLVMLKMDIDLRNYLQQNHNQLIWKERIMIMCDIIPAISQIHFEKAIHRNLHSGNILYSQFNYKWRISASEA
ncbi:hypothetical protein C1645_878696 [Glomus cerebriforme]|uniref:Protein kinase domain-containing protein n=1 Tax=Glomus cerebriforme TaxID=658196 RepID=A0A397SK26_9GLOM|nr:hypothetical protein C1645_878696 [Glomus cerebriforme]